MFDKFQDQQDQEIPKNEIRLSQLNSDISHKLRKFDVTNDGALSLQEAVHAIITLQKQSNNYKRMFWLLIPVLLGLIACTFGTTMLAFKINQQIKTSSSVITTMDGSVARVGDFKENIVLQNVLFTADVIKVEKLYGGPGYSASILGVSQSVDSQGQMSTSLSTSTFTVTFKNDTSSNQILIDVVPFVGYEKHHMYLEYKAYVEPINNGQTCMFGSFNPDPLSSECQHGCLKIQPSGSYFFRYATNSNNDAAPNSYRNYVSKVTTEQCVASNGQYWTDSLSKNTLDTTEYHLVKTTSGCCKFPAPSGGYYHK